jgi:hypothetical protein
VCVFVKNSLSLSIRRDIRTYVLNGRKGMKHCYRRIEYEVPMALAWLSLRIITWSRERERLERGPQYLVETGECLVKEP